MKEIKVTINGKEIITTEGKTILSVVHENHIDKIPTLCYDERIEPYGSCFLCVVEVAGMNRLVASCCTPVSNGMVITTDNDRIRSSRKTALELLLSNHYADCIGPCINNCPANVDAQAYIALIDMGKYDEALKLIKQQNPMPLSIGRVCVRDCETACRRQIVDESVAINHLKRYVADIDYKDMWKPQLKPSTGKKVAVIGAGPSGLTCAYYLSLEGHNVTIFEKFPRLGGMLMYGIPEYRLPKEILDTEINWILKTGGITVKTGQTMGKDFDIPKLFNDGFDSVYLAVGAHKASAMRLEHENDTENIWGGIEFLRQIPDNRPILKGTVIVVGGGNTAIDAARTSLRCGADNVKIVYRRSLNEMPANPEEIHAAQAEGIDIMFLNNPKAIIRDENKKLKGIVCLKMKLEEVPGDRPRPVPMEGSDFEIPCDYLISAIGQQVDTSFNPKDTGVALEKWGTIIVNEDTLETSVAGVFAGGDAVTGPLSAIKSISQGKQAALAIDAFLRYGSVQRRLKPFYSFKHKFNKVTEAELSHFKKQERNRLPELEVADRIKTFEEVELGYSNTQAHDEPKRCLECGCSEYYDCQLRIYADQFGVDITNYMGETRKYKPDTRHPFITMDSNKCINCGRCVRTCSEILTVSALGFVNRGFKAVVKPAMEKPLLETGCIACGNCIDTCPTGAITEKFPFKVLGTLAKANIETICNFCSIGCKVNFKVINDDICFASNSTETLSDSVNRGYLCVKGRFGHRYFMKSDRLLKPLISDKKTDELKPATMDEAIDFTAQKLKSILTMHGPESVAIFASPKMTNEELYLLQKFARAGLKTNNIGSFSYIPNEQQPHSLDKSLGITTSTASIDDIPNADVIIVVNGDLNEQNLVMELRIKEAQKNHGTQFVLIDSSEIKVTKDADLWIDSKKGTHTAVINGMINHVIQAKRFDEAQVKTKHFDDLVSMVKTSTPEAVSELTDILPEKYAQLLQLIEDPAKNIVFVYNLDSFREKTANDLEAIGNFLLLTGRAHRKGSGIIMIRAYANSTGLMEMGMTPDYLPGVVKPFEKDEVKRIEKRWGVELAEIFQPVDLVEKMHQGEIKAVLVFGEDPLSDNDNLKYFKGVEFLMVQDLYHTATTETADVIIPAASFIEQEGTMTACDGRVQKLNPLMRPKNGMENWKIVSTLAKRLDMNLDYEKLSDITREIEEVNRLSGGKSPLVEGRTVNESGKPEFAIFKPEVKNISGDLPRLIDSEAYFKTIAKELGLKS